MSSCLQDVLPEIDLLLRKALWDTGSLPGVKELAVQAYIDTAAFRDWCSPPGRFKIACAEEVGGKGEGS